MPASKLKVIAFFFSSFFIFLAFLIFVPAKVQAITVTVSEASKEFNSIVFNVTPSSQFVYSPTITIYRDHNCDSASGTYVNLGSLTIAGDRRSATYNWSAGLDYQKFSVQVDLNDTVDPDSSTLSNCLNGRTLRIEPEPIPEPPHTVIRINIDEENQKVKFSWNNIENWPDGAPYLLGVWTGHSCVESSSTPVAGFPRSFSSSAGGSYEWTEVENGDYWVRLYSYGVLITSCNLITVDIDSVTATGIPINLATVNSCSHGTCQTGLGPLPDDAVAFVNRILGIAIGIAAGIAFLLLIFGGFRLSFSHGDPKAVQEAREVITAAIIGLLIIVFSVFLLRLIGFDILGLPI